MADGPLFTREGPAFYAAAFAHNSPFAQQVDGSYFTPLGNSEEQAFREWVKRNRVPFDVHAAITDYDMRGYWSRPSGPDWQGGDTHFPDTWKTPWDTTFSAESRYATSGCPFKWHGERLIDERDGSIVFEETPLEVAPGQALSPRPAPPGIVWLSSRSTQGKPEGGEKGSAPTPKPGKKQRLVLPRVRGIASSLDDLMIGSAKYKAALGDLTVDGILKRKITGASVIELDFLDPQRKLLKSKLLQERHTVTIDGLPFAFVGLGDEGRIAPTAATYEALVVNKLRRIKGPHKAFRDKMTRAEFNKKLADMVTPVPRFICPELHTIEPIATAKQGKEAEEEAEETRGKGLGNVHGLTVGGVAATSTQINTANRGLKVAESLGCETRVMEALIVAMMDETLLGTLGPGTSNVLESEGSGVGSAIGSVEQESHNFLTGGGGYGGGGAIGIAKHNSSYSPAEIATTNQRNKAFIEGGLKAGAEPYERFSGEAKQWVAAYGGSSSESVTATERYAFEQDKKTGNWEEMVKLADEVRWRMFESAGWLFYIAEPDLLKSVLRLTIGDSTPGIIDTRLKYDEGKEVDELTVEAFAREWAVPPGCVAGVEDHGVGDGVWIVETIESPLGRRNAVCQITLQRPHKPLPEPAPTTKKISLGTTGSPTTSPKTPAGAPPQLDAMLAAMEKYSGVPYAEPGESHGATFNLDPKSGDCSGMMSLVLHAGGYLDHPVVSGDMANMYEPGKGNYFVLYANAAHVWCEIRTKDGWVEWEEGGTLGGTSGFLKSGTQSPAGYSARHPKGL